MSAPFPSSINPNHVPRAFHQAVVEHVVDGQDHGHFITAVLANDLGDAACRADDRFLPYFRGMHKYLYNHVPKGAWGSREAVQKWLDMDPERRAEIAASFDRTYHECM